MTRIVYKLGVFLSTALIFGYTINSVLAKANRASVYAKQQMVSAANPVAVRIGLNILRAGGSAVDAAIAVQMVLTLVEPQSSGIGGGAFLLNYKPAKTKASKPILSAYDGRETAPRAITENLFLKSNGDVFSWDKRKIGGRSVGVPGTVHVLGVAHKKHGRLPWKILFDPAIQMAKNGFAVSPRLHKMIKKDKFLKNFPEARNYFYLPNGKPLPIGYILKNPKLAETFKLLAEKGPQAFYSRNMSVDIANAVQKTHHLPGKLTAEDIQTYNSKQRPIICGPYKVWKICGMPPPTSGGVAVIQTLGMLERFNLGRHTPNSAEAIHLVTEASRLAFADRNLYLGDPDFVQIPSKGLINTKYLQERSALISKRETMKIAIAGKPPFLSVFPDFSSDNASKELNSTSHIAIVDSWGEAISMTTTIGTAFGSRIMIHGFMLNDELADFAANPRDNKGKIKVNAPQPKKRPRSSMSPTFVLDREGNLIMTVGSPGGSSIIGYVIKTLIAVLDWKMHMQEAIDMPNFLNKNKRTELEKDTNLIELVKELQELGHNPDIREKTSGLSGIRVLEHGLEGGADSRREGIALGD
ncbi:MAG: gamma-glutamyltransferase [Rhodospirillaceae bacterium]|nr:gamma-glutamyltransferase [Rhodospirillaceae bacterium]